MPDRRPIWVKGVGDYWKPYGLTQLYKRQLVDMARKRSIKTSGRNKKELIEDIKAHHEQTTFSRFLDLPPELRLMVYEFYFDDFNFERGTLRAPAQPPITMASRLLRAEATPLFYAHVRFNVKLTRVGPPPPPQTIGNATEIDTEAWITNLDDNVKDVKHLRLSLSKLAIDLDLGKSDPVQFLEYWRPHPGVPLGARQHLEQICHGLEGGRLSFHGLRDLRRAALLCYRSIERSRRAGMSQ